MVQRTTTTNISSQQLDRYYFKSVFSDADNPVIATMMLRKLRIIINNCFCGEDRDILLLLLTSSNPLDEVSNLFGSVSSRSTYYDNIYGIIKYVRRVLVEIVDYFNKNTYKESFKLLKENLSSSVFSIFMVYLLIRNMNKTARLFNYCPNSVNYSFKKAMNYIDANKGINESLNDLHRAITRIRLIKRSYFFGLKKYVSFDLSMLEENNELF